MKSHDAREIRREMAAAIKKSGEACIEEGFVERGNSMLRWAEETRVEAECIDEDGYVIYQQGHA